MRDRTMLCAQVLTAVEEFAVVRDKLQELGQHIDHDLSGLVYTPLMQVEVRMGIMQPKSCCRQQDVTSQVSDAVLMALHMVNNCHCRL